MTCSSFMCRHNENIAIMFASHGWFIIQKSVIKIMSALLLTKHVGAKFLIMSLLCCTFSHTRYPKHTQPRSGFYENDNELSLSKSLWCRLDERFLQCYTNCLENINTLKCKVLLKIFARHANIVPYDDENNMRGVEKCVFNSLVYTSTRLVVNLNRNENRFVFRKLLSPINLPSNTPK